MLYVSNWVFTKLCLFGSYMFNKFLLIEVVLQQMVLWWGTYRPIALDTHTLQWVGAYISISHWTESAGEFDSVQIPEYNVASSSNISVFSHLLYKNGQQRYILKSLLQYEINSEPTSLILVSLSMAMFDYVYCVEIGVAELYLEPRP